MQNNLNINILQQTDSNEILRKKCRALSNREIVSHEIQELILEMRDIMHNAPGVGLAAPQIGYSLQLAVIEDSDARLREIDKNILIDRQRDPVPFHAIINPQIIQHSSNIKYYFEGCLSVSNCIRIVPRYESITVKYLDLQANPQEIFARGWHARILQHEIDHLHGILNIDHSDARTEVDTTQYKKKWMNAPGDEIWQFYCDRCSNT